jgi:hypothetical protein
MSASSSTYAIDVSVRIRPLSVGTETSPAEVDHGIGLHIGDRHFGFASSIVTGSDQTASFDSIGARILDRLNQGFSCTLLAFGQTGSGKTYSMFGPQFALTEASLLSRGAGNAAPEQWGIFPRIMLRLLEARSSECKIRASAVEIYQDRVFDLMSDRTPLSVGRARSNVKVIVGKNGAIHNATCTCFKCFNRREKKPASQKLQQVSQTASQTARARRTTTDKSHGKEKRKITASTSSTVLPEVVATEPTSDDGDEFVTSGETMVTLTSPEEVARFARTIEATRIAEAHKLNARSSRSHCLVRVQVVGKKSKGRVRKQQFLFVDLAGSERIKKSGVSVMMRKFTNFENVYSTIFTVNLPAFTGKFTTYHSLTFLC